MIWPGCLLHAWLRPDGDPVEFVIPACSSYHPIIAYIGVLRIRAATDLGNMPMARAFQRAGYENFEREINMTWS